MFCALAGVTAGVIVVLEPFFERTSTFAARSAAQVEDQLAIRASAPGTRLLRTGRSVQSTQDTVLVLYNTKCARLPPPG